MSYGVESILDPRRDDGQTDRVTDIRPVGSPHSQGYLMTSCIVVTFYGMT